MSSGKNIYYSDKYFDEKFEYRHVMLPKDIAKLVPKTHLMSESEWRKLGVQQSQVSAFKKINCQFTEAISPGDVAEQLHNAAISCPVYLPLTLLAVSN